jgi:pyruvate/2-oxoglutarate dehydrogenase complex dihydrolipoamide dehydrogenase (E3) component
MAQAFRCLGAQVTVLDQAQPLAKEDPECATIILDRLARDRIAVRPNVSISLVGYGQSKVQVVLGGAAGGETIEGSHLLMAVGRRPYLEGLGVDRAGIKVGPRGIVVDRALRTTNKHVHAIGDAAGAPHFVHAATYDASLVIRSALFRLPVRANRDLVPRVVSTEPALAHVGLSEPEARRRGYSVGILRWPFVENDRVTLERAGAVGHIKVVISRRGDVLGCTIVGPGAAESIAPWSLAVSQRLHIRALAGTLVPYPTFAEVGKRAAMSYFSASLTSPMVRRIITSLRRFR